jgi:hypothetical protein
MVATSGDWKQSLNLNGQILASGQVAGVGIDTTIYQVPTGKEAKIATATVTNISVTDTTISLSVVPGTSALSPANKVWNAIPITAGQTLELPLIGAFLETGALISVNAGAAASINYLITGVLSY